MEAISSSESYFSSLLAMLAVGKRDLQCASQLAIVVCPSRLQINGAGFRAFPKKQRAFTKEFAHKMLSLFPHSKGSQQPFQNPLYAHRLALKFLTNIPSLP